MKDTSVNRNLLWVAFLAVATAPVMAPADDVIDWNSTLREVIQTDVAKANPGLSTRAMAMTNSAIYDVFQAFNRTHDPFLVDTAAGPNTSLQAAVHQAAYEIMLDCYPAESGMLSTAYNNRMNPIPGGLEKTNGMNLGSSIAQQYVSWRTGDHSGDTVSYTPGTDPGQWRPDPYWPGLPANPQTAWGPGWGTVTPFAVPTTNQFVQQLPDIPSITDADPQSPYVVAFNQVRDYGALNSSVRSAEQTEIGLFWGYDRPTMGPPPVLFSQNLDDIATQTGNSQEENARLFAMASVAMADAATAAWDAKFQYNFWRPVTAILEADTDGNPNTADVPGWRPLGAPGGTPGDYQDDFTPPFPAWTSGHATMGGAVFKALELFYGTNVFDEIDGILDNDEEYALYSAEFDANGLPGMSRDFTTFTMTAPLDVGFEALDDSPEGENAVSRIYLGIHWIFDQRDGVTLGNSIAEYVNGHYFYSVPEPGTLVLALLGGAWIVLRARRTRRV